MIAQGGIAGNHASNDGAALFDSASPVTLGEAALIYGSLGWPIIPVAPHTKSPLVAGGFKSASTDRTQIERWWNDHPDANIGYRPDGRVVVDADSPSATRDGLHLPPTAVVKTGRGYHYFYNAVRHVRSRNAVRPWLDIKGPDGYVILPPSVHPDGTLYEWLISPECMVEAPNWIYGVTKTKRRPDAGAPGRPILQGERETYLTRVFGAMRRQGATAAEMLGAGRVMNGRCAPPLFDRDLRRMAESIARYEPARPSEDEPAQRSRARADAHRARDRASARGTTRPSHSTRWRPERRWSRGELAQRLANAPTPMLPPRSDVELGQLAEEYERIAGQPISSPDQWNFFAECSRLHGDDLLPLVADLFAERRHANNLLGIVRMTPPRSAAWRSR